MLSDSYDGTILLHSVHVNTKPCSGMRHVQNTEIVLTQACCCFFFFDKKQFSMGGNE